MNILYASSNAAKVGSLQRRMQPYGVNVVQAAIDLPEPRSSDTEEIARAKSQAAFEKLKQPCVVLDAGFYVSSLNGFPRAFVNFALETIGLDGILRLASGGNRACEFRECLVYADATRLNESRSFTAHQRGTLALEQRGAMQPHLWSPLALIFVPYGETKTLAEMDCDEYLAWSRRSSKESSAVMFTEWFVREHQLTKISA